MKIERAVWSALSARTAQARPPRSICWTGVYRPTDGGIRLDGQEPHRQKPHEICKLGVARTFQNIRLFSQLSVLDNVKRPVCTIKITYSFAESIVPPRLLPQKEKQMDEKAPRAAARVRPGRRSRLQGGKSAVRQSSASSRSRVRSLPTPSCCCSTSLPRV